MAGCQFLSSRRSAHIDETREPRKSSARSHPLTQFSTLRSQRGSAGWQVRCGRQRTTLASSQTVLSRIARRRRAAPRLDPASTPPPFFALSPRKAPLALPHKFHACPSEGGREGGREERRRGAQPSKNWCLRFSKIYVSRVFSS